LAETNEHTLRLRSGRLDDAEEAGRIIFEAFATIAEKHGFPPDFPSVDVGRTRAASFLSNPGFYSVIAEDTSSGGKVVGSSFIDERSSIAGVGPLTVDPI
jgi:hypothetical protein